MMGRRLRELVLLMAVPVLSPAVLAEDVSGEIENPNSQYGKGVHYRLVGKTTFGWKLGQLTGDLNLNGHDFTMETGGGNQTVFSGVITGTGHFRWNGGGNAQWQTVPSFLTGNEPNTFNGTLTVLRGTLALAKPDGITAFAGDRLVLGGGGNQAIIRLDASEQLGDTCRVQIVGPHEGRIWTQGNSETLGTLELRSFATIDLGDGKSKLRFADCSNAPWDLSKTLTIQNWTVTHDEVSFGTSANGLTTQQLARIGFDNPSDRKAGLYSARILADGRVIPDRQIEAVNAPFDVSEKARAARRKIYDVPGRKMLSGQNSPLADGTRISFFGDSITWQNNYISEIGRAIEKGEGTQGFDISLFNHGINGGGVLSVRDGVEKAAFVDQQNRNGAQAPFAEVIAADKADIAVVFIGINDVWWRKTTEADFEQALRDLVKSAEANKTTLVLDTLTVYREKPDGSNPMDQKCDRFADITRTVARSTETTLVDLRSAYLAYLQNHNAELRVDGSLNFLNTGVLTYDGVHPNATGNELLADLISRGIYDALRKAGSR